MFSASYAASQNEYDSSYYFIKKQLMCAAIGLVGMFVASFLDYNFFFNTKIAYLFFTGSLALCVYTAFFGQETAGARRWVTIFGVQFQPSEILKIAFIVIFSYILSVNCQKFAKSRRHSLLPFTVIFVMVFGVLALQRHMSAIMLFGIIGVTLMFVSDIPPKYFWQFIAM
jgi:cell division protein FtsW